MNTGPSRKPASSIQVVPVISPLPFNENQPAKTWSVDVLPRGRIAVTPVRTGPVPTFSAPSPEMSVVIPTSTPATSVMAFSGPGVPSKGTPRSRARGFAWASRDDTLYRVNAATTKATIKRFICMEWIVRPGQEKSGPSGVRSKSKLTFWRKTRLRVADRSWRRSDCPYSVPTLTLRCSAARSLTGPERSVRDRSPGRSRRVRRHSGN